MIHLIIGDSNELLETSNYTKNKNNKRLLLKAFSDKVMTIYYMCSDNSVDLYSLTYYSQIKS